MRFKSKLQHQLTALCISTLMGGSRRESATCDQLLTSHDLDAAVNVSWTITRLYKNEIHIMV